jgi:hypothetical protein
MAPFLFAHHPETAAIAARTTRRLDAASIFFTPPPLSHGRQIHISLFLIVFHALAPKVLYVKRVSTEAF